MRVGAVMPAEYGGGLNAGGLQHVNNPDAGPFRAAGAAIGPLIAARLRIEKRTPVAAAFQNHAARDCLELRLQFAKRELKLLIDLTIDHDLPAVRILGLIRDKTVIADIELVDRGRVIVEQALGRLGDQRLLPKHHKLVALAGKLEILR